MSARDRAERAGWQLDETCECAEPRISWGGGDGYYLPSVCWRCRRRAPYIAGDAYEPDSVRADIWDAREGT